ncbi:hypothetical protein ACNFJ7_02225 [Sphingomonas sp. HT-1]|uniref:hypothetical protein n=1 Tax=unclassified Sphingomonas TaxID=196159 RepID=UPI0002D6FF6A|nr:MULTISPECIES: hypothetical protein [unclassified Sphingomonas]KTF70695.1 hypothetical protein ATB93_18760 [Sphingomonas sp. WG]
MSSQTAAGTKLAISAEQPASENATGYAALTFTTVGGVEQLGAFGASFAKVEFQPLDGAKEKYKGSRDNGALTVPLKLDSEDAGQALMQTAAEDPSQDLYSVKVTYSDGAIRYFGTRVFGMPETVGGADTMIMANPVLEICTDIVKVAAP